MFLFISILSRGVKSIQVYKGNWYIYICACICTYTHACMYIHTCACTNIYMHAYIVYVLYTCVHVFSFMYMLYNKYACIFVSVCVRIYEYIFPCNHNPDQDTEPVCFLVCLAVHIPHPSEITPILTSVSIDLFSCY